jgi:signal transduction histidine kinase
VKLSWQDATGTVHDTEVSLVSRPLADQPFLFWYELVCALGGLMIAGWVRVLRAGDRAAHFFAITGLCMFAAILANSLYVNRELAVESLRSLVVINHSAVLLFGCAFIDLFLCYPAQLVKPRHLVWPWLIYIPWLLLDTIRLFPDQTWGTIAPIISQLIVASVLAIVHWLRSRRQPLQRAALRWYLLSFIVSYWLFVFTTVAPIALGYPTLIPIGYAAGFIFLTYIGLALGVSHYRLFELDVWAYRILITVVSAVLVAGLDLLMIWALNADPLFSLGWALFLAGWIYFPLRQWIWQWLSGRPAMPLEKVLPDLIDIAFTASAEGRERRWQQLLIRLFAPLDAQVHEGTIERAKVADEGLSLLLPACGGMLPRELRFANHGKRLFTPSDAESAQGLCDLMASAAASRDSYERGALEERGRVYRDLHDDIGAKLLTLAIGAENPVRADIARSALHDLRDVVSHGGRGPIPLSELLADWRAEMDNRLAVAGARVIWRQPFDLPDPLVGPGAALHLGRILREATSNVLRHAEATSLEVDVDCDAESLELRLRDDGKGLAEPSRRHGKGLVNMRSRAEQLGGSIDWRNILPQGCEVRLTAPCHRLIAPEALS